MATGLISNALPTDPTQKAVTTSTDPNTVNVAQATATGYNPSVRTVDPATQTVSGQLAGLLSQDNPVMQKARADTMGTFNQRGLLNSSMAASGAENAVIQSALPIASSDASTYQNTALANQAATNQASQFGAGSQNQASLANAAALNVPGTQAQAGQIQTQLQQLRGTQAVDLANIEANFKTLMQTSASASSFYSGISNQIAATLNDVNTSADQKANAVSNLTSMLNSGLSLIGSIGNVDLSGLLNFQATAPAAPAPASVTPFATPQAVPAAG